MEPEDLRLDGNAAAGLLAEVFGTEMTVNWAVCATCGAHNPLGAVLAYIHGMGAVLRCPRCGNVLLRVAQTSDRYVLDLRGIRTLEIRDPPSHADVPPR